MTGSQSIKRWYGVHKWTSLICTAFMLLLCITGLPLVFHHEIEEWLEHGDDHHTIAAVAPGEASPDLDRMLAKALERHPDKIPRLLSWSPDEPRVFLTLAPPGKDDERDLASFVEFDTVTGGMAPPHPEEGLTFMQLMFRLHVDLFAGLPGMLFLGLMGMLLVVAIISGIVVYGPFMRKLEFGTVRKTQSSRLKWLDMHNMLGIVTLCWALVVGATGVINTWSTPLIQLWQLGELSEMVAPYKGKPEPAPASFASLQQAVETAKAAAPGMEPSLVLWPRAFVDNNRHHYLVLLRGDTPLTSKLLTPVLIEVETGKLHMRAELPWYLSALLLSQPLHFGDYGGLPLKVLWALLDIITIIVLGSGLYLWIARRRQTEARIAMLAAKADELAAAGARDAGPGARS